MFSVSLRCWSANRIIVGDTTSAITACRSFFRCLQENSPVESEWIDLLIIVQIPSLLEKVEIVTIMM
jgi:hypothetical protein